MKDRTCLILSIIAAIVALAAIVTTIIVFREQIGAFFSALKAKIQKSEDPVLHEDYVDFADV